MNITKLHHEGRSIARVTADAAMIGDVGSALDLMAQVRYETGSSRMVLDAHIFHDRFFDLSTRLAGEILQKFTTYSMRLAVIGDFSRYSSRSLQAFISESNRGNAVLFVSDESEALRRLSSGE